MLAFIASRMTLCDQLVQCLENSFRDFKLHFTDYSDECKKNEHLLCSAFLSMNIVHPNVYKSKCDFFKKNNDSFEF